MRLFAALFIAALRRIVAFRLLRCGGWCHPLPLPPWGWVPAGGGGGADCLVDRLPMIACLLALLACLRCACSVVRDAAYDVGVRACPCVGVVLSRRRDGTQDWVGARRGRRVVRLAHCTRCSSCLLLAVVASSRTPIGLALESARLDTLTTSAYGQHMTLTGTPAPRKSFTSQAVKVGNGSAVHVACMDDGVAFASMCGAELRSASRFLRPVGVQTITCKRCGG